MKKGKYINLGRILHYISEVYFNRPLPRFIAKGIAKQNIRDYKRANDGRMILETYDGSYQFVHPDFIKWHNKVWLVCTPYPYGYNKCENPSVYVGDDIESLKQACENPIDFPSSKSKGSILCDPCLFENGNMLSICYRERIQTKKEVTYKLHVQSSKDGLVWGNKHELICKTDDPLISPAVISWNGKKYLYHVHTKGLGGDIVVSDLNVDMSVSNSTTLKCVGLPNDLLIWHIGLHSNMYTKEVNDDGCVKALLMIRNKQGSHIYKAHQDSPREDFIIDERVNIPDTINSDIKAVYKSSYMPDGKIALSFYDNKNRLSITVI